MKTLLILVFILTGCNVLKVITQKSTSIDDDFFSESSSSSNTNSAYVNLYPNDARRDFYTYSDAHFRTFSFDYNAEGTMECSTDDGVTWQDCIPNDQNSNTAEFTWDYTNYNITHYFKNTVDGNEYVTTFLPAEYYPTISFGACTSWITVGGSFSTTFNALNINDGDVICIDDGVTISNSGAEGEISFAVDNVKIVANSDSSVMIQNNNQTFSSIFRTIMNNIDFYGINMEIGVDQAYALSITGTDTDLWECSINSYDNNAYGAVQAMFANTTINYSNIYNASTFSGSALDLENSDVTLNYSNVTGGFQAVSLWNNAADSKTFNVNQSNLYGEKIDYAGVGDFGVISTFLSGGSYDIHLVDSLIYSNGGSAIAIKDAGQSATITLTNTAIQRGSEVNFDSYAIFNNEITGNLNITADSTSYFCNDGGGSSFSLIYNEANINTTFDVTVMNQHSAIDDIPLCSDVLIQ